ncbi:hypothetical protein [Pseudogemmobacter sonorensis]|uniref:hypothetical protein n=1 Tax=Pseudogemmobacter sonorensis TaxID=2989681 RepID=UPI0036A00521
MTMPHMPSDDAVPVASLGLDDFETGLLAVLRHFMTAFARPETQAWQSAFALATELWGGARGPQVAQGLLTVVQVLRQARRADFHYANPLCPECSAMATGEEAALCLMLHAMRRDRADLARGAVMELTDGRIEPGLLQSALAFCARFPAESRMPESHVSGAMPSPGLDPAHRPACPDTAGPDLPRPNSAAHPSRRHLRLIH